MTLESLVSAIEERSRRELEEIQRKLEADVAAQRAATEAQIRAIQEDAERRARVEAERERARILAGARLQSRRILFEAQEARVARGLELVRAWLGQLSQSPEYPRLLSALVTRGVERLGTSPRVLLRSQDLKLLPPALARLVDTGRPLSGLGGAVIESADGSRRLNLTFEELLRLREDALRAILAR